MTALSPATPGKNYTIKWNICGCDAEQEMKLAWPALIQAAQLADSNFRGRESRMLPFSLKYHLENAKKAGVTRKEIAAIIKSGAKML